MKILTNEKLQILTKINLKWFWKVFEFIKLIILNGLKIKELIN